MQQIIFATSNKIKMRSAAAILRPFGIKPIQHELDFIEIQAGYGEPIARDKAQKAFDMLQKPLVISDDSWLIPGLNGFPGPYMKWMNQWFSPEDFLRLTASLSDRRVTLQKHVVYQDEHGQQHFCSSINGTLLNKVRGHGFGSDAFTTVVSFTADGRSVAEYLVEGRSASELSTERSAWHDLAEWLQR